MTNNINWTNKSVYPWFLPVQTRWLDNDQYGHVNNAVYHGIFDTVINVSLIRFTLLTVIYKIFYKKFIEMLVLIPSLKIPLLDSWQLTPVHSMAVPLILMFTWLGLPLRKLGKVQVIN